ncbi:uncharacterized protein K444DRAFT_627104 [Hyaloscypha bicolor E]|uniref:Uncharacterized protein n=1 Tax=Hyaloscypha bicolor E TaxID=1095630 RepID=A0A2J6TK70_9HELO|nr:uncharacterized protein K444DRAFT_627104 [Hyaloscypha bicolor E]PMD63388.1 hypothetical protein K444DRAFT_627104 [Hyaloscypha bicolor E]
MPRIRTGTPETTTWWRCCQETCEHREVNNEAWGTTCPDCSHEKCEDCEENITPSASSTQQNIRRRHRCETTKYARHARQPNTANYARPSNTGWWICCKDRREVNPKLWGDECPDDQHQKCSECRTLS